MTTAVGERHRIGTRTMRFETGPRLAAWSSLAGHTEQAGPLGGRFDEAVDDLYGEHTWEKAERKYVRRAVELCLKHAGLEATAIDLMFSGDLLDQIVTSNYAARDLGLPFYGLFGACSVSTLALSLAAALVDGGYARRIVTATASHHLTAERQYRFPVEMGVQRLPTQSWTATGGAAFLVGAEGDGPRITSATAGKVIDLGIKDPNNMGAAMAPAAADTIAAHFHDLNGDFNRYDLVMTGDLGRTGHTLLETLLREDHGIDLGDRLQDAGILLYRSDQDVHAGGSGPACSALVFAADVLPRLKQGDLQRVLLVATGALHSPTTYQQGESVPGVAHAVSIEGGQGA